MSARTYKKYMKKKTTKDYTLWKLFVISFLGMLLVFTFAIKSFSPTVDVSIGEYSQEDNFDNADDIKKEWMEDLPLYKKKIKVEAFLN